MRAGPLLALVAPGLSVLIAGCDGIQSALPGYGEEAARVARLFWVMLFGGTAVVAIVAGAVCVALFGNGAAKRIIADGSSVVVAGIVFPVTVLSALLIYGFWLLDSPAVTRGDPIRVAVVGEQWWWRITYRSEDGSEIETANELRVPLGRPVELELTTADVIHSFWAPPLAGKVDMIPGHVNTLRFTASSPGIVRGQCAEYCGGAHALMAFYIVVETPEAFPAWLADQSSVAQAADPAGLDLFLAAGCGGCHRIRGTQAGGTIGPDLTHVGSRLSIGAGLLRTGPDAFARWIASHAVLKPANRMPPFEALSDAEIERLASYLAALD